MPGERCWQLHRGGCAPWRPGCSCCWLWRSGERVAHSPAELQPTLPSPLCPPILAALSRPGARPPHLAVRDPFRAPSSSRRAGLAAAAPHAAAGAAAPAAARPRALLCFIGRPGTQHVRCCGGRLAALVPPAGVRRGVWWAGSGVWWAVEFCWRQCAGGARQHGCAGRLWVPEAPPERPSPPCCLPPTVPHASRGGGGQPAWGHHSAGGGARCAPDASRCCCCRGRLLPPAAPCAARVVQLPPLRCCEVLPIN